MTYLKTSPSRNPAKAKTGIEGFDEITRGGLPRGRTTLLEGGPGSGKTLFALRFLVYGAQECNEPGIFVAFEESSQRIVANAASFGWNLPGLQRKKLFFLDAQPTIDPVQSGNFDLSGMLAALGAQAKAMGARRVVFDAVDIMLALLPDAAAKRREVYRRHDWEKPGRTAPGAESEIEVYLCQRLQRRRCRSQLPFERRGQFPR